MTTHTHRGTRYFTHGTDPHVLLLSGMHGSEATSGKLLAEWIIAHTTDLPPFLFIPEVSPSAVSAQTRTNRFGNDINRQILEGTRDEEAQAFMDIVSGHRFDICIDIHEDPDRSIGFYLYDTGRMTGEELALYRETVHQSGARLYTGIDDVDDEHLRLTVEKGYVSFGFDRLGETAGFSSRWLYGNGIVKRDFTVEVPGKAGPSLKKAIISRVVPFLLSTFGM